MPIVPTDINDINFSERDLFLDVRLTTVSITDPPKRTESGFLQKDFTGRPTFQTGFFRDGIGFGITNVKITTNASLQPLIEIEFKDLYGKTVFGELQETPESPINYGAIFQWPPPKFEFTFKGYLGKPVTWILNLKSTSTDYDSSDGSYKIKAVFVPNQWGMFADIPFLYLYAVKKLRMDSLGTGQSSSGSDNKKITKEGEEINSEANANVRKEEDKVQSIFDIMYIGKKIQKEKNESSKEYDDTVNKLALIKQDPIGGLVAGNLKIPKKGEYEKISSAVPGYSEVKDFVVIKLAVPEDSVYQKDETTEVLTYIKTLSTLKPEQRNIENIRIKVATYCKTTGNPFPAILSEVPVGSKPNGNQISELKKEANKLNGIIDKNLERIENAIKGRIYKKNEDEIAKLTICEVFGQIARDTAFIMGYILDAGEQGYLSNPTVRQNAEKKGAIGLYFPMVFKKENNSEGLEVGKQVPANKENASSAGIPDAASLSKSVEEYELRFVNEFITAVSYGIAQNRALQAQANEGSDNKIKNRVNNAEIISQNPFKDKSDWKEIASIILKRAGIVGYLTQSNDPNCVGDYCNYGERSNTPDEIRQLADSDVTNVTDEIVAQLDTENFQQLKDFCSFFMILFEEEGKELGFQGGTTFQSLAGEGWKGGVGEGEVTKSVVVIGKPVEELVPSFAKDINAKITDGLGAFWNESDVKSLSSSLGYAYKSGYNEIDLSTSSGSALKDAGFKAYTVEQYLGNFIGERYIFFGRTTGQAKRDEKYVRPSLHNTVNFYDTIGHALYMNGLFLMHPNYGSDTSDMYWHMVVDDSADVQLLDEFTPINTSDGDFAGEDKDASSEPKGLIDIDKIKDSEGDDLNRVQYLLDRKEAKTLIDFSGFIKNKTNLVLEGGYSSLGNQDAGGRNITSLNREDIDTYGILWDKEIVDTGGSGIQNGIERIDVTQNKIVYTVYGQNWDSSKECPMFGLFGASDLADACRVFLRQFCKSLKAKLERVEDEQNKAFGSILGRAGDHADLIYQQMHNLFHQWQILAHLDGKRLTDTESAKKGLHANIANRLEEIYSSDCKNTKRALSTDTKALECGGINDGVEIQGGFRYDYPLQPIGKKQINVAESVINIDPLYSTKADTTILNAYQQLATKNNFMFFPIPGNPDYDCISDIFQPVTTVRNPKVGNYFQVLFQPTPESRSLLSDNTSTTTHGNPEEFAVQAFPVRFGDPTNKIIKNVTVGTDDNKSTAESIVNLQRIVDNENKNKTVTTDCSLLSVFEGRSYTATIETLGNAQLSPMQFFYIQNHTIFTGLYQIMKVEHSITPNDMSTNFQGIKMRYAGNSGYGGVHPITLQDFKNAANSVIEAPFESNGKTRESYVEEITGQDGGGVDGVEDSNLVSDTNIVSVDVGQGGKVSTTEIQIPPSVRNYFNNTNRFGTANGGNPIPANGNVKANLSKSQLIKNMNEFLADRWGPFADFMAKNYPKWKGKIAITSTIRTDSATSQHGKGQACDFGISGDVETKMKGSLDILNALFQFLRLNNLHYDQILFETRDSKNKSVWIHWSYARDKKRNYRLRFHNDKTVQGAPMNNQPNGSIAAGTTNLTAAQARANRFNGSA